MTSLTPWKQIIKGDVLGKTHAKYQLPKIGPVGEIILFPYQRKIYSFCVKDGRIPGHKIIVAPPGAGKTEIYLAVANTYVKAGFTVIIAAPRRIITQAIHNRTKDGYVIDKQIIPFWRVVFARAGQRQYIARMLKRSIPKIIVATHSLLCLLQNNDQIPTSIVVIVDEAHLTHINKNRLGKVTDQICANGSKLFQFTASPFRSNDGDISPECEWFTRPLTQHYLEGCCPNVSILLESYGKQAVTTTDCEQQNQIGADCIVTVANRSTQVRYDLLKAYVQYWLHERKQTLVLVDNVKEGYQAAKMFGSINPKINVLNLASLDGEKLFSTESPKIRNEAFRRLKTNDIDVVIAINLMDFGGDWPDCCQVFSPRIPRSFVYWLQCLFGRSLRLKRPDHQYRDYSDIVVFLPQLTAKDQRLLIRPWYLIAAHLKAIAHNPWWTASYRLRLPRKIRVSTDKEKDDYSKHSNKDTAIKKQLQRYYYSRSGITVPDLIAHYQGLVEQNTGVKLSTLAAFELLDASGFIKKNSKIIKQLTDGLNRTTNKLCQNSPEIKAIFKRLEIVGVADIMHMLGHNGTPLEIDELVRALYAAAESNSNVTTRELCEWMKAREESLTIDGVECPIYRNIVYPIVSEDPDEKRLAIFLQHRRSAKGGKGTFYQLDQQTAEQSDYVDLFELVQPNIYKSYVDWVCAFADIHGTVKARELIYQATKNRNKLAVMMRNFLLKLVSEKSDSQSIFIEYIQHIIQRGHGLLLEAKDERSYRQDLDTINTAGALRRQTKRRISRKNPDEKEIYERLNTLCDRLIKIPRPYDDELRELATQYDDEFLQSIKHNHETQKQFHQYPRLAKLLYRSPSTEERDFTTLQQAILAQKNSDKLSDALLKLRSRIENNPREYDTKLHEEATRLGFPEFLQRQSADYEQYDRDTVETTAAFRKQHKRNPNKRCKNDPDEQALAYRHVGLRHRRMRYNPRPYDKKLIAYAQKLDADAIKSTKDEIFKAYIIKYPLLRAH